MKQQDGKLTVANKRINLPKVDYPPNIINLLMNKMKKDKHIKVLFHLEQDEDGYPPFSIEGLWCKKASNDTYNWRMIFRYGKYKQIGCTVFFNASD